MAQPPHTLSELRRLAEKELLHDILPFWAERAFDPRTGELAGVLAHDLRAFDDVPRHAVLCARILWTFAAASRLDPDPRWTETGRRALALLGDRFTDRRHGGVYWSLGADGRVLSPRKQVYAQAFAIYGLAEWHLATREPKALADAQALFERLEAHAKDPNEGGYIEALAEDWGGIEDQRLSDRDLNAPKSMNTILHVMEAYTTLYRAWPDARVRRSLRDLVETMIVRVIEPRPFPHCALFFDMGWHSLQDSVSYGHDIEASWLLWDAVESLDEPALRERVRTAVLGLAEGVLQHGMDADGAVFYAGDFDGVRDTNKHWWPQAEAVVGFLNAYSLGGKEAFLAAALNAWRFIEAKVIDRKWGEWFSVLDRAGRPLPDYPQVSDSCKIGPWKCPYHNSRVCLELIRRL